MDLNLKIDPEFERVCPPLTGEEFDQLQENILEEQAILMPFIVWDGFIIDGHNRYTILQKHPKLEYTIREKQFQNRFEALAWICKNQLGRRNLTPQQRKYLIGQRYEAEKHSHGAGDGFRGNRFTVVSGQNVQILQGKNTSERIAEETHTNPKYVRRAGHYAKGIDAADTVKPGLRDELLSGRLKATDQDVSALAEAPPQERPDLVEAMVRKATEKKETITKGKPSHRKVLREIEAMGKEMVTAKATFGEDDVIREMQAALDEMISRWDFCENVYPEIVCEESCQNRISTLIEQGLSYFMIKRKEQVDVPGQFE